MKDFIAIILKKINFLWNRRSNDAFCKYLKTKGITIRGGVKFRYPEHTVIDLTRPSLVEIGNNVDINDNFTLLTHDYSTFVFRNLYKDFVPSSGKVIIGNNVYFGRDVTILKGVTIGDNCIIGLGSIVTKSIPANSVVCGAPARVICSLEEYYQKRKAQSIQESLTYAKCLEENLGRELAIHDFTEEWALFFRKQDFKDFPEMHNIIDWRLAQNKSDFWENHKPIFDGFDEFIKAVHEIH